MIHRHKLILLILLLVGLALNALTFFSWDSALIANDGVQYISTAENWLAGNGLSTSALIYSPHFQSTLPATQTVWPPGFSLAIAATSKLGLELKTAVLILNLIMHAMASLLVWWILLRLGVARFFAAVCAFFFYAMALPWAYVSAGLTEPVFTSLLLASLLLLPDPKKSNLLVWISCGLIIAAGIFIRYSNVFVAFGTGAGLFAFMVFYERRSIAELIKPCFKLTLLIAIPTVAFLYLMQRTYSAIGTLDRYSGTKIPETLSSTATRWVAKSSELTGFASTDPANGWFATLCFGVFIIMISSIVFLFFVGSPKSASALTQPLSPPLNESPTATLKSEQSLKNTRTNYFNRFWLVTFFQSLSFVIYLSVSSLNTTPLEIITRYLYQIYPAFYALFCYALFTTFKQADTSKKQTLVKTITSTLVVFYLMAQLNSLRVTRPIFFNDAMSTVKFMELEVHNSVNINTFIKRCFANGKIGKSIWSPHAQPIHLHTGVPTISQGINYTDQPFDAELFKHRIDQYQIGMFVFINYLDYPNEKHDNYMKAAKHWLADNGYFMVDLPSNTVDLPSNALYLDRTIEIYSPDPKCDAS